MPTKWKGFAVYCNLTLASTVDNVYMEVVVLLSVNIFISLHHHEGTERILCYIAVRLWGSASIVQGQKGLLLSVEVALSKDGVNIKLAVWWILLPL